jgi:hypothetical protein
MAINKKGVKNKKRSLIKKGLREFCLRINKNIFCALNITAPII